MNNIINLEKKNKGGRAPIVLTDEQVAEVEQLAATLTSEQMADHFGIDADTFTAIKRRQPSVGRAYKKGKSAAIAVIARTLQEKAREGDTAAMIFYLKTQAGWSTAESKDNRKLAISSDMTPLSIIDAALTGLNKGDISAQEATQIASLALTKANIMNNSPQIGIGILRHESREDRMEELEKISKLLLYRPVDSKDN